MVKAQGVPDALEAIHVGGQIYITPRQPPAVEIIFASRSSRYRV